MENLILQNSVSSDKVPVPSIEVENQNTEFEFGSVTEPTSPKSPADHLFFNGRLLPHFFPVQTANAITRSTSRASSITSKDSLISSRSSSTISSTSSCDSSARTSISTEGSEQRRVFLKNMKQNIGKEKIKQPLLPQYGGSSRRWQFIAPSPVMKHGSRRKKSDIVVKEKKKAEVCICWRILKWFVWVYEKCHAIESPCVNEDEKKKGEVSPCFL